MTFRAPVKEPLYPIGYEPVPLGAFRVTRSFGDLTFPQHGAHDGLDVGNGRVHDPIVAMEAGSVIAASFVAAAGGAAIVRIDHGDGWSSGYAHMDRIDVTRGQKVTKGQQVGILGSTGWVSGAHLHFDITRNGQRLDPWPLIEVDDVAFQTRPVREKWRIPAGLQFYVDGPGIGTPKTFTTAAELWSNGETTDGVWRRLEYHDSPTLGEELWAVGARATRVMQPIPGTRNPSTGYGSPSLGDCSTQDAKLTEARLAVTALRGQHTEEGAALEGVARALG